MTAQRRLLLGLIRDAKGHIDAKELYRRASERDESISLATVYRNLHLFKQLGLVDERRLGQMRYYYEIRQPPEHQHMVCTSCGRVIEFQNPLMERLVENLQYQYAFKVTKAELYLEGYCSECNEAQNPINRDRKKEPEGESLT